MMQIIVKSILPKEELRYFDSLETSLFFDIETTGFSRQNCVCYLIGVMFLKEGQWFIEQYFASVPEDERDIIQAFIDKSAAYDRLISFNGDAFDIPFLNARMAILKMTSVIETPSVDILKVLRKGKYDLPVPNLKLKTLEQFAGVYREDKYSGGDLIGMYFRYLRTKDEKLKRDILLHNFEDIENMLILDKIMAIATSRCSFILSNGSRISMVKASVSGNEIKLELEWNDPKINLIYTESEDSVSVQENKVYVKFRLEKTIWQGISLLYCDRSKKSYLNRLQTQNHPSLPREWLVFSSNRNISDEFLITTSALFLEHAMQQTQGGL